eukprot:gene40979-49986_t
MWINITIVAVIFFIGVQYSHQGSDLEDLLRKASGVHSSPNPSSHPLHNTVLLTAASYPSINLLYNFKCFLDRLKFKFIVLSLDFALYNDLANNDESILAYPATASAQIDPLATSSSKLQSQGELNKLEAVYSALEKGYDVLFVEVDTALLEDPAPRLQHADMVFAHDGPATCDSSAAQPTSTSSTGGAGLFFVRSNAEALAAVSRALQRAQQEGLAAGDSVHSLLHQAFSSDKAVQFVGSCANLRAEGGRAACVLDGCSLREAAGESSAPRPLFLRPARSADAAQQLRQLGAWL